MLKPQRHSARRLLTLAAGALMLAGSAGCRDSAPDDLIQEETTTEALCS